MDIQTLLKREYCALADGNIVFLNQCMTAIDSDCRVYDLEDGTSHTIYVLTQYKATEKLHGYGLYNISDTAELGAVMGDYEFADCYTQTSQVAYETHPELVAAIGQIMLTDCHLAHNP